MGHPLEVHAGEIYTSAVYKKFEEEFYKSMSLRMSDCISPTKFEARRARPAFMVDYESRAYIVSLKDGGDFISCNCGYFQHIGMLCRHSIKVKAIILFDQMQYDILRCLILLLDIPKIYHPQALVRNDIFKIPVNNILKRWTRKAKEGYDDANHLYQCNLDADDSAARQNIL